MFDSPISKTQAQLVQAARAAATDYIQNGTDLTDAVVKVASDMQPITSEHVRRICEMTYHDAYERLFAEKTGMYQYVSFDPPNAILAAEMLDAIQLGVNQQHNFDKLASMTKKEKKRKRRNTMRGAAVGGAAAYIGGRRVAARKTLRDLGTKPANKSNAIIIKVPKGTKDPRAYVRSVAKTNRLKVGLLGAGVGAGLGAGYSYATRNKEASMDKTATALSMPRKFQRMNTHEFWMKAASGKELQDHNPTRELQQVHRDLKDSISTVKSELYAAEQNEKLAMIDMVKQARAGLSAGHSMEQVLHAAVSVVDATEPFMAKTAHDLCATIIEACADHQNSGFRKEASFFRTLGLNPNKEELDKAFADFEKTTGKHRKHMSQKAVYDHVMKQRGMGKEAQMFMGQKEMMNKAKKNSEGWEKNPMKLIYNFDHDKKAAALQEVNPNHPIPQKFKKLAEANIQRKHLEVTLDELNRNMDYYNQRLIDGLTR